MGIEGTGGTRRAQANPNRPRAGGWRYGLVSKHNNGGPAFPETFIHDPGMTLRDWFAGQALGWMLACAREYWDTHTGEPVQGCVAYAASAYAMADAMLAERDR